MDDEIQGAKDEYLHFYKASKIEARRMFSHPRFEEKTALYWKLLRKDKEAILNLDRIPKQQYVSFMKKVYKALLPLYREEEMHEEIQQEWLMDSDGEESLNFDLFNKLLFRIAHSWATHVDLDEYLEILDKIYQRITIRQVIKAIDGSVITCHPTINCEILPELQDGVDLFAVKPQFGEGMWENVPMNEQEMTEVFEYQYYEDEKTLTLTKQRRRRAMELDGAGTGSEQTDAPTMTFKDPINFRETPVYYKNLGDYKPGADDLVIIIFADLEEILPIGYVTEQFLVFLKNDVNERLEESKKARKEALAKMKREPLENGGQMKETSLKKEEDDGIIKFMTGKQITKTFSLITQPVSKTRSKAFMSDYLYNALRISIKDTVQINIKCHFQFPKAALRSGQLKNKALVSGTEPSTEINKFGYNPALQRRIFLKQAPIFSQGGKVQFINIWFTYNHQDYETAFRCDVEKTENASKLAIKPDENFVREEDFIPVETSYKKVRQIMLSKKFETLYSEQLNAEETDLKRIDKMVEREESRKKSVHTPETLQTKGVAETYEAKSIIKTMRGPLYKTISKEGMKDDNFLTTAQDINLNFQFEAQRILILGKPRTGKTTLAKQLSKQLDLMHISVENWIKTILEKKKNFEAPEEVPEGEEPPKWGTPLEVEVEISLKKGEGPTHLQNIEILLEQIHSPLARTKGYILDLNFYQNDEPWSRIIKNKKFLPPGPDGTQGEFTHIIELEMEDEEIKHRAKHMKLDPLDGQVYSRWEITERNKPKPVKLDDDGNPIEEEEDENAPKPLVVNTMIQRVEDTDLLLFEELKTYNISERPTLENDLILRLFNSQYLKIDAAGLTPQEIAEQASLLIRPDETVPLRPLPIVCEGAGSFKELLTKPLSEEEPEGTLPRNFSVWQQQDTVALSKGIVVQGSTDFAVAYSNHMFVFANEANMKEFIQEPKKFLRKKPSMPKNYRLMMVGPKGIGVHTQARKLEEYYGWKVVDYQKIVRDKLNDIFHQDVRLPNNVIPGTSEIGLSKAEIDDIKLGKPFPSWKFIPWILDFLGYKLQKRPPPEEPNFEKMLAQEGLTDEEIAKIEKDKKKKEQEDAAKQKIIDEKNKAKEERRKKREEAIANGEDVEDSEEEPPEDLSIDDLILHESYQNQIGGFIFLGFPLTEIHCEKLKAHGIFFDKVLSFVDTSEENPGKRAKEEQIKINLHYDWDQEVEKSAKVVAVAKEFLQKEGEELTKEINAIGSIDQIHIKIRAEIDPYFVRVDNPDDVRVSADLGEEDKRLPKGDFGDFCPVTYINENWLVRGNPEKEATVYGKTHIFADDKELEEFKFNPAKFLSGHQGKSSLPLEPPKPKIMILGNKGAGITTITNLLCDKFKLEPLELKKEFLKTMASEKEIRKRRRLLTRGFRPLPPAEEDAETQPVDAEIEDDPEDFDKSLHEQELIRKVLDSNKGLVIDGTWNKFPPELENILVANNFDAYCDLLINSRRVPEVFIILKCDESNAFQRLIDKPKVEAEYERLIKERKEKREKLREIDRVAKQQEIQEALAADEEKSPEEKDAELEKQMADWKAAKDEEEEAQDAEDPEMPNLDNMLEVYREGIRTQREQDEEFLNGLIEKMTEKGVPIISNIKSDLSPQFVLIKLLDQLKDHFQRRQDFIERQLVRKLDAAELPFYEKSYYYRQSKFARNSPFCQSSPMGVRDFPALYRERIYYLADEEEREKFLKEPSKYTKGIEACPSDVQIKPKISIIGLPRSGKTTLAEKLQKRIGAVHLQINQIISEFIDRDSLQSERIRQVLKKEGKTLEDQLLIALIQKRMAMKDCASRGWILEDFPNTKSQAIEMARAGVNPFNVFSLKVEPEIVYQRTLNEKNSVFDYNRTIIARRMRYLLKNLPHTSCFYLKLFNSLVEIDGMKSIWFMKDRAYEFVQANIKARQELTIALCFNSAGTGNNALTERPLQMQNLSLDQCIYKSSLSQFGNYCPVTWKNTKILLKCNQKKDTCIYYKNQFFYFKSQTEKQMFIENPRRFVNNVIFSSQKGIPIRLKMHKASEIISQEKALIGYCPVSLLEEQKVVKGDNILIVQYKDVKFSFQTESKLQKFLKNPAKYNKVELPVRMPPAEDKITLFALQNNEESTTFMEQALGSIVTKGLLEVADNRLKHPEMSVKETMLKLFAIFLKAENAANTKYMKEKYTGKLRQFIETCEIAEELNDLSEERANKQAKGKWPEFKEKYYQELVNKYEQVLISSKKDKANAFMNYIK